MKRGIALEAGAPDELGAHATDAGINFAVHAPNAERVELCLFDDAGTAQMHRLLLPARTGDIWHGLLPGATAGVVYGYRVHGPYAPERGERFNPHKLLTDPYARALVGSFAWHDAVFGYDRDDAARDLSFDPRDSAPYVPKCRVVAAQPPRPRPPRPRVPWTDTVVYEMHVRGFTRQHPQIPEPLRGKIAALAQPVVIDYLRRLGVTTVEWLPIAAFLDEYALARRGLSNYWGYNPIAFLAAQRSYLVHEDAAEIANVVDRLHLAGIEVVLDVVFNHTAESDQFGPTLSLRGLDNQTYYRLDDGQPRRYHDFSGCGNTLDCRQAAVVDLIHAALRYWALEIGVDGFRFDLATALGRGDDAEFDAHALVWRTLLSDRDLAGLKLIAEPWDAGPPLNARGRFPTPFAEWNDRYRDGVRRFWRGDDGALAELATRFGGSSDMFAERSPTAGVNFVTAHDGFTLADLVAYRDKHNEANGEAGRDGASENLSSNAGIEGPVEDAQVLRERRTRARSMLATLLLSRGVPMLLAGDELSRSQSGNNNAYCQDNPLSWLDWSALGGAGRDDTAYVRCLLDLRRALRLLREDAFWTGVLAVPGGSKDIHWLNSDGSEMAVADWHDASRRTLGIWLVDGDAATQVYLALNADRSAASMRLPPLAHCHWLCVIDSAQGTMPRTLHAGDASVGVSGGALRVFVPQHARELGVPSDLLVRAEQAGVLPAYEDNDGQRRLVPAQTLERLVFCLGAHQPVAAHPHAEPMPACWINPVLRGSGRRWLFSLQLYGLHSAQSWGIGDFADLGRFAEIAGHCGAAGIMLSPLHAPHLHIPEKASPYSPSSRFALNPLLISLPALEEQGRSAAYAEFLARPQTREALGRVRDATYVDYPEVTRLKLGALGARYGEFRERHLDCSVSALGNQFRRFQADNAVARPHAIFEALHARFGRDRANWPAAYRQYDASAIAAFAHEQESAVEFYEYLQWLARRQWDHAVAQARNAGLEIGLVADLALGADVEGADAWQWPDLVMRDMELGAPADAFAPHGQAWGLPPWHPKKLADMQCQPFADLLDIAMRGAGAIRIDHVMGLMRQFWIARGEHPERGAYVQYPFDALLRVLAQASQRRQCMVIGEDLGSVPQALRERLADANIFGYRVVYFERNAAGEFVPPECYPRSSVAAATTHDLPTLAGFCAGDDILERECRGMDRTALHALRAARENACAALERALHPDGDRQGTAGLTDAVHRFLMATHSALAIVQIEDVLGMRRQANLPGTEDSAPNWRQRLPLPLEDLGNDDRLWRTAEIFRGRQRGS